MEKRTKRLWIRVSEADMTLYKRKAESFGSVSDMVRTAVARLDEPSVAERMRRVDALMKLCRKIDNRLSWEGSNVNQLARRANEAHRTGVIPGAFFTEVLMPELRNVRNWEVHTSSAISSADTAGSLSMLYKQSVYTKMYTDLLLH